MNRPWRNKYEKPSVKDGGKPWIEVKECKTLSFMQGRAAEYHRILLNQSI